MFEGRVFETTELDGRDVVHRFDFIHKQNLNLKKLN